MSPARGTAQGPTRAVSYTHLDVYKRQVWVSGSSQDGSADGIHAQRYSANGVAVGPEFRVNTTTAGSQYDPAVVGLSDGSFVVAWTDNNGTDGSSYGVYAQRFSASGVALGAQFLVNAFTTYDQGQPKMAAYNGGFVAVSYTHLDVYKRQDYAHVASLSDGGFVITWQDYAGYDGSSYGVFAQRYDAAGVAQGGQFVLSTYTESTQFHEAVCALSLIHI